MEIHYNAFISYRHHPLDIKVAEQIHRGLEHYRIPKALKQTGNGKFHLFRDKDELPITSNLTDDISRALEYSDFLIVICSTHTKESIWVQREIEAFLQTHDRSRILTVIADGEPHDVIPEILCTEQQVDPVTGQTSLIPIEPLSCDWRFGKRKAYREELPRLAAALLGCGYDELRQRERQYRTRRIVCGFSAALVALLCFSAYVVYNSMQIQKANQQLTDANIAIQNNLRQAQINQSQFLASASEQQAEAGDRMQAMALALEALPGENDTRPYVARAEKALADAAGAYLASEEIAAVGAISCDAFINLFSATDDRDWMFVTDQRNLLSVWDLETFRQTAATPLESIATELLVTPENTVIVYAGYTLSCYDTDLHLLWQTDDIFAVHLSEDRKAVIAENRDSTIVVLDAATGKPTGQNLQIPRSWNDSEFWYHSFRQETYDLGKPLLLNLYRYDSPNLVVSADLQTGSITEIGSMPPECAVWGTAYASNGNILVLARGEDHLGVGFFSTMTTNGKIDSYILCFSPEGELLWTTDLTSYTYADVWTLHSIADTNRVFCQVDNILAVLDLATGEVITCCETSSLPLSVEPDADTATIILQDGSMGLYHYDEETFNSIPYFKDDLSRAFSGKGVFTKQRYSSEILVYTTIFDHNWQPFSGEYETYTEQELVYDNYLVVSNYDGICIFDTKAQQLLLHIPEPTLYNYQLLGFTHEGKYLWVSGDGQSMLRINMQTKQQEEFSFPDDCGQDTLLRYSSYNRVCMDGGTIYTVAKDLLSGAVYMLTLNTHTLETTITPVAGLVWDSYDDDCELRIAHDGMAYLWFSGNGTLYQVNTDTQTSSVYLDGQPSASIIQYLNDGSTYMVATADAVSFYNTDGSLLFTDTPENKTGVSAYRTSQGEILLLTDAGDILRYSSAGERLSDINTSLYNTFSTGVASDFVPEQIQWTETGDGDLFVNIMKAGNLIHMDCWELRAWIPNCLTYLPSQDQFVTSGKDPDTRKSGIGAFPRYTTEDIRQMALDEMHGYTLTQDKKEYYGIS